MATLDALAAGRPFALPLAVPEWTLGCFERRCITYATGEEDTTTRVIWVQSHGLTGDIRIPNLRPNLSGRGGLSQCAPEELAMLAVGEGFAARTGWSGGLMSWETFAAFQPYEKWVEPGRLERVGTSLIEWAPSGVYVEDWRLQPGSSGLSVGLRLMSETGTDGVERPRDGALVIAGDHALQVIARRKPLPPGRAQDAVGADPSAVFDCQIAYGRKDGEPWRIDLAVDPFEQGLPLFEPDGFETGQAEDEIVQVSESAGWRERRWRIDTLLAGQDRPAATPANPEGLAWLTKERVNLGLP